MCAEKKDLQYIENIYRKNNKEFLGFLKADYGLDKLKYLTFKEGESIENFVQPNNLYYIKSGVAMRSFYDYDGNHKSLDIVTENELLGLATLFGDIPAIWEITILEDMELLVIPENILVSYPQKVYKIFGMNLQYQLTGLYVSWQAMLSEGKERINYAILSLLSSLGEKSNNEYIFPDYISHEFIAKFAAVSRSYVTRHLSTLVEEEVICVKNRKIYSINVEKLLDITPNYYATSE